MCLRRAKKQTQPSTLRAKKKLPKRRSISLPWTNGRPSRPRRRVPNSTCGKLARDLMLTPSGKRRRSTRRRTRRRMMRKRKLSSTSSDRLARRNLTSTSPLLTREDEVEAIVDVAVVAVERDVDVEAAVVVMVKDVHPTGST